MARVSKEVYEMMELEELVESVEKWHKDRNLIEGSTDKDQVLKLIQEMGELSDNVCKGNDIRDDVGDMLVVLINIAKRNNLTLQECLEVAWNDTTFVNTSSAEISADTYVPYIKNIKYVDYSTLDNLA